VRVAEYLPDWPHAWNTVRVHQLLGHTSGIPDFWFVPEAARLAGDLTARAIDLKRVMAQVPLEFEPGTRFSYSNTAYHAAARIIERRTGLSYDAYLAREFFTLMGMTSMHHCRGDAGEMAGHVLRDGQAVAVPHENYETARGDGGLCGSARDLARWFRASASGAIAQGASWDTYGIEAPHAIEGIPPALHAGQFDVGPFVVSVDAREGGLWLESPVPGPRGGWFALGQRATRSMAIPGA
jgi:CubicO group peptidase (beta-lactamase class C family)